MVEYLARAYPAPFDFSWHIPILPLDVLVGEMALGLAATDSIVNFDGWIDGSDAQQKHLPGLTASLARL